MSDIGDTLKTTLTTLLGRDLPEAVSDWLSSTAELSTVSDTDDTHAGELSDAELYEIAEKLLAQAETATDADEAQQYTDIAQAIFAQISEDDDNEISETDDATQDTDDNDYVDKATEFNALKEDLADGDITKATNLDFLIEKTTLNPTAFASLSPEEQAVTIEYYQNADTSQTELADAAIKSIPSVSLDDVIANLYESDSFDVEAFLKTRFSDVTGTQKPVTDIQADIESILSPEGSFANLDGTEQANLVSNLLGYAKDDTVNDTALATTIITELQNNTDFVDAVNASDPNGSLQSLQNALGQVEDYSEYTGSFVRGATFTDIDTTDFETALLNALEKSEEVEIEEVEIEEVETEEVETEEVEIEEVEIEEVETEEVETEEVEIEEVEEVEIEPPLAKFRDNLETLLDGSNLDDLIAKTADTKLTGDLKILFDALNDEEATSETKNVAFDAYFTAPIPAENFDAIVDLNSVFYTNESADKEQLFEDLLAWLETADEATQKAFIASIPAYSELHLSLIDKANELLENDEDSELGKALKNITDAITGGTTADITTNDIDIVFPTPPTDEKEDDNNNEDTEKLSDYASDIVNKADEYTENNATSPSLRDFIDLNGTNGITETDITIFLSKLKDDTARQDFFEALLSDDSAIYLIDNIDLGTITDTIIDNLTDDKHLLQFLAAIPKDGKLIETLQNNNVSEDIIDEIIELDSNELPEALPEIFNADFKETLKTALSDTQNALSLEDYTSQLDDASDLEEIKKIFDTAQDNGDINALLSGITNDNSDYLDNPDVLTGVFAWLDDNTTERNAFLGALPQDSLFTKAIKKLIDEKVEPFDTLSYSVDEETGNIAIDSSDRDDLSEILSDTDNVAILISSIEIQQAERDEKYNSVGGDNQDLRNLTLDAQKSGTIDFSKYLSPDDTGDYSNAEELIELITTDDNYLLQSLDDAQLKNFVSQFTKYLKTADDTLVQAFGDSLDSDSIFGKALIAAGASVDDIDAGEYTDVLNDATDFDAFVASVTIERDRNQYTQDDKDITDYVADTLRGLEDGTDIDKAVDNILLFAFADEVDLDILLNDVLSEEGIVSTLTKEQADTLTTALFKKIADEDPEDGEDLSDNQQLFLDNLENSYFYEAYIADNAKYQDIQDYFNGEDISDEDVAQNLNGLLTDNTLIGKAFKGSTADNETKIDDSVLTDIDDGAEKYQDEVIIQGYQTLVGLFDKEAISGESGQLSNSFFNISGQSPQDIAQLALDAESELSFDELAGLIAILPPEEAAEFIEEYLANYEGDNVQNAAFLLGQLQLYQIDGDIDDSQFESIINNIAENEAIENNFSPDSVKDLIDNPTVRSNIITIWGDVASDIFNSDYDIDAVIADTVSWVGGDVTDPTLGNPQGTYPPQYPPQGYGPFPPGGVGLGAPFLPPVQYPSAQNIFLQGYAAGVIAGAGLSQTQPLQSFPQQPNGSTVTINI